MNSRETESQGLTDRVSWLLMDLLEAGLPLLESAGQLCARSLLLILAED